MAPRHLRELLGEEQEPFALKRFIDERRCQLRRPTTKDSPCSQHRHHHHLPAKRQTPAISESRPFSPSSALVRSPPSARFASLREPLDAKKSPLLHLPAGEKSPSSASRLSAALLLQAAVRIQKKAQEQHQGSHKNRRRRRKEENEAGNPSQSQRTGLCFLGSMLKTLVLGKRQKGITGEGEAFDASCGENAGEAALRMTGHREKGASLDMHKKTVREQIEEVREKPPQRSICSRCGIPQCPRTDGDGHDSFPPTFVDGDAAPSDMAPSSIPSPQVLPGAARSSPPSELQTPASSPAKERRLVGGAADGDKGREDADAPYHEEKKEQFSPVSILDPPFDDEDHRRSHSCTDDAERPEEEDEEAEQVEEEPNADKFQQSLAFVQRAKRHLLGRIRRFERLAELDPVELERRLSEDDDDEEEEQDASTAGASPPRGSVDMGAPDVHELVRAVLFGSSGGAGRKTDPAGTRRLVLDLAEEEKRGGACRFAGGKAVERVKRRYGAWREVEANTVDLMVATDLIRAEAGGGWQGFTEHLAGEAAAQVEEDVVGMLVDEVLGCMMSRRPMGLCRV